MSSHFKTPIIGSPASGSGAFKDLPLHVVGDEDWMVYKNDFLLSSDIDVTNDWTLTTITAGTAALVADSNMGIVRLDCPGDQQGPILQLDGGSVAITPSASGTNAIASEAVLAGRIRLRDAGASSFFFGLAEATATSAVLVAAGTTSSDTHAGFHQQDPNTTEAGAINMVAAGDTNANQQSSSLSFNLTDDEWVDLAVRITGTQAASFYARRSDLVGARGRTPKPWVQLDDLETTNAWDAAMFPTIALAGSGTGDDLDLDKLVFAVRRDLTVG